MIYTQHARDRMAERHITEADVNWVCQTPMHVWTDDGNRLFRRWWTAVDGNRYGIYVVLAPDADRVVTVFWG
jgi:hypothetical protein